LPEFRTRVEEVAALLEVVGLARSENLQRNLAQGQSEAAAELLLQSGAVERVEGSEGEIVRITEGARDRLAYYRATIAPALVWPAALALALRAESNGEAVLAGASSWLDVLALEYFPPELEERQVLFDRLLTHFEQQGWIEATEAGFHVQPGGEEHLVFLSRQLRPTLETYRALLVAAVESSYPTKRGELLDRAKTALEEQLLLGEAKYPEAVCPTTLGNALLLLVREGILQVDGNPRSPDAQLLQGLHWSDLAPLRERVAAALRNL
jgi:glycerol-3-phosphate O-acyltransferase